LAVPVVVFLAAVGAAGGCGGKAKPPTDVVSGTIRVGDKKVNFGFISFYQDSKRVGKTAIQTDGTYNVTNLPKGEVRVVVEAADPPQMVAVGAGGGGAGKGGGDQAPKYEKVDVPARYADLEKTDVHFTVTGGQQQFDIVLEPK
jgi:hypothetical protein